MKDSLILLVIGVALGIGIMSSLFCLTRCVAEQPTVERDTVVVVDTVTVTEVEPAEVREVGAVKARLPLSGENEKHSSDSVQKGDFLRSDTAEVVIPIEQKVFTDTVNYRAVVSGYNVALDTIEVYNRREYITERVKSPSRKRWGLSVGVGAVVDTDGRISPGVFAGVTYTFVSF